ncbi:mechanosensitive ion channel [Ornithinimicrobium sp. CNJ-824]|uniref:mechanosensitive ion channel n=1 Tax=Ornithinimicrobium sp. CNJ-824 TaxID=1904966 RepID=UPI000A71B8A4|nr:mechanosensitive ion channel [Ornithinimicrobium sp. CNJ-824]
MGLAEKALLALLILVATWILAKAVQWAITKLVAKLDFFQREARDGESLGQAVGKIGSLLVWLLGLIAILQVFALDQVLAPVQGMLGDILGYLPNIIGAGFVFFIGWIIAKIVKQITETALDSAGFDRAVARLGDRASAETGGRPATATAGDGATATDDAAASGSGTRLSTVVANLLFAVILIVVTIAALQILGISAISDPAEQMLTVILDAIPRIIAAAILLGLGYVIARFAAQLLETTLRGLGTDRAVAELGAVPEGRSASSIIARVAQIAILLFFAVMAARVLEFPEVTDILEEIPALGGRVIFGGAIIAAGVFIANLLRRTMGTGTATTVVYWATIALFVAMGLKYMGIADSIINLAFGAVVVGAAAAAALAYGLGGRDAAARSLKKVEAKAQEPSGDPAPTSSTPGSGPQV